MIVSASPLVRVVILTTTKDPDVGIAALRAGASGFVTKDVDLGSLPRILAAVKNGEAKTIQVTQLRTRATSGPSRRSERSGRRFAAFAANQRPGRRRDPSARDRVAKALP